MAEQRIQFSNIVQNQLPAYVKEEFPLVSEFLKSYYQGQEYQGGPIDLINNIDSYIDQQLQNRENQQSNESQLFYNSGFNIFLKIKNY